MRSLKPRLAALAAVVAILAVACSSSGGGGSVTVPSGVTRPTSTPTAPSAGGGSTSSPEGASTEAPTTAPPQTEPPRTAPPRTETPATTEAPAKESTTTAAATTTTAVVAGEESSTTWWPWLLVGLAVVAVIVGIVLLVRSRKAPAWPAQVGAALDESDEITTHLVGLTPGGLTAVAGADATRLATLMASVQQLVASAPDDASRRALAAVQEPLRSLHGTLDAVALRAGAPTSVELDEVRAGATELHSATSLARASLISRAQARPG